MQTLESLLMMWLFLAVANWRQDIVPVFDKFGRVWILFDKKRANATRGTGEVGEPHIFQQNNELWVFIWITNCINLAYPGPEFVKKVVLAIDAEPNP